MFMLISIARQSPVNWHRPGPRHFPGRHTIDMFAVTNEDFSEMKLSRVQIVLASIAILLSAVLAEVLAPHELMARTSAAPRLDQVIPKQFGTWTLVPEISPVTPSDPEGYVQPDPYSAKFYSQEVGRGYTDGHGNVVMLMVAYGPVQNYRLKAHRPEMCYTCLLYTSDAADE